VHVQVQEHSPQMPLHAHRAARLVDQTLHGLRAAAQPHDSHPRGRQGHWGDANAAPTTRAPRTERATVGTLQGSI